MDDNNELNLIHSKWVNDSYKKFYDKYGYIPQIFNPYNCKEILDYAPTLTSQGDSITKKWYNFNN